MVEAEGASTDDGHQEEDEDKKQGVRGSSSSTGVTPRKRNIRQSLPRPSDCANDGSKPPLVPSSSDNPNVGSARRSDDDRIDFDFRTMSTLPTDNTANAAAAAPGDGTSRRKAHGGGHFSSVTIPQGATTGGNKRERNRKPILSGIKRRSNVKDRTSSSVSLAAATTVSIDGRSVEERRLNRIVTETGEDAWGVDAVEVWLLENDNSGRLHRPDGGYWRNPDMVTDVFLSRLEDKSNPMFVPAEPLLVGVDLPGHLWAESAEAPGGGSGAGGAFDLSGRGGTIFGGASKRGGTIFRPPTPSGSGRGGSLFGSLRGGNRFSFAKAGGAQEGNSPQGSGRGGRVFTGGSLKGGDVFAALSQAMGKPSSSRPPTDTSAGAGDDQGSDKSSQESESDSKAPDLHGQTKKPKHRRMSTWSSSLSADPRSKLRKLPRFGAQQQTDEEHFNQGAYIPRVLLNWRDIHSLVEDPDTPNTLRLNLFHNAGFNYAAGVKFRAGNHLQGIVIFFTQLQEDAEQLLDFHNQVCMIRATEAIGSVVAANEARKAAMAARPSSICETDPSTDPGKEDFATDDPWESTCVTIRRRAATWSRKCLGGSLQIPPAMTLRQSLWTLFGCFSGLLLLSGLNDVIHTQTEGELFFFMGPIGALMALQYGLTAAPASQPRNALLGQAVAGGISLSFTYVPENIISRWMRQAIAPSLAITAMGKLGVMHPPAGAASIILASGQHGWKHYGLLLLASLISLLPAVFINNASMKRQYPTHSWRATLLKQ